ncbi:class I SAM-dependent methyltransferase [Caulobacter segnis]
MDTALWNDPDLRAAPTAFRAALRVVATNWDAGSVTWILPTGKVMRIAGDKPGPDAVVRINDYNFIRRAFSAGTIGFAEGFMAGEWETPDLSAVLEAFSLNSDRLSALLSGNPVMRAVNVLYHLLHGNSRAGSKRNIHAHYDLGNGFYSRWLDPSMTYSSALHERPNQPLPEAQAAKYAALARTIDLAPRQARAGDRLRLGRLRRVRGQEVGAKVTGITISQAQYDFARKRLFEQGLSEKADIRLIDYRDVEGQYDAVASIEMFEAVGEAYWPAYFDKIREVLRPGGRAGLQIITIRDELFSKYRGRTDFIQRYIFPGGMLPSGEARLKEETERAGLEWSDLKRFGQNHRRHPGRMGPPLRGRLERHPQRRFRRTLPAPVAVLSQLLRGRLPDRADKRHPAGAEPELDTELIG